MPSLRACDCCSRRKVRCDRQKPCQNCQKSDLFCSYASKPKKRGPKGPTKIIQELRLLQAQQQNNDCPAVSSQQAHPRNNPSAFPPTENAAPQFFKNGAGYGDHSSSMDYEENNISSPATSHSSGSPMHSPGFSYQRTGVPYFPDPITGALTQPNPIFRPHRVLTPTFASTCASIFFQNLYPIMPIFDRTRFHSTYLATCHSSPQSYALVASMCALTLIQLCAVPDESESGESSKSWESAERLGISSEYELEKVGKTLLSEALRARRFFEYIAKPDLDTVITSFFLFCCYGNLENHDHAWYYLRESISFAQGMGLDDEKTYWRAKARAAASQSSHGKLTEGERWRRMFWLLFITERAYAIQRHHPLTLCKAISLPEVPKTDPRTDKSRSPSKTPEGDAWEEEIMGDEDESMSEAQVLSNFVTLAMLFQNMGDTFVSLWNQASDISEMLESPEGLQDTEYLAQELSKLKFSNSWVAKLHQKLESIGISAMESVEMGHNSNLAGSLFGGLDRQDKSLPAEQTFQPFTNTPYTPASKPPSVSTSSSTENTSSFIPIQKADILVSCQWLHLIIWRLSVEKVGWLRQQNKPRLQSVTSAPSDSHRDDSEDDVLGLTFPVKIAKGVLEITAKVTVEALEAHGIGMQEKLFDIGCSLADVIKCVGNPRQQLTRRLPVQEHSSFEVTRRQYLHEIVRVLSELRGGKSRFFHDILQKVEGVLEFSSPVSNGRDITFRTPGGMWEVTAGNYDRRIEAVDEEVEMEAGTEEPGYIDARDRISHEDEENISDQPLCEKFDSSFAAAEGMPLIGDHLSSTIYYNTNSSSFGQLQNQLGTTFNSNFDAISPHPSSITSDNMGFLHEHSMNLVQFYGSSTPFTPVHESYLSFPHNLPIEALQTPQSSAPPSVASFQGQDLDCDGNPLATYYSESSTAASAPPSIATISTARSSTVSTRRNSFSASDMMYSAFPTQYMKHTAAHFQFDPAIGERIIEEEIAAKPVGPHGDLNIVEYPNGTWGYM